jgi:Zn-dependent metalloprotease
MSNNTKILLLLAILLHLVAIISCNVNKIDSSIGSIEDLAQQISKLTFNRETGKCSYVEFKEPYDLAIKSDESVIKTISQRLPIIDKISHLDWKMARKIEDPHLSNRYTLVFNQFQNEIPTFDGEIRVHMILLKSTHRVMKPAIHSISLNILPNLEQLDTENVLIDEEEAIENVQRWAELEHHQSETLVEIIGNVIYRFDSNNYQCWWMRVSSVHSHSFQHVVFIDVQTGDIINSYSDIKHALNREVCL